MDGLLEESRLARNGYWVEQVGKVSSKMVQGSGSTSDCFEVLNNTKMMEHAPMDGNIVNGHYESLKFSIQFIRCVKCRA